MRAALCRVELKFCTLRQIKQRQSILRCRLSRLSTRVLSSKSDAFFSDSSFESFALSPILSGELARSGYKKPSQIQGLGMGSILEGKDVLLAAETGSGKTLAYLLPLVTRILHEREGNKSTNDTSTYYDEMKASRTFHRFALVLCPSVDLCRQVQSVLNSFNLEDKVDITSEVSPAGLSRYKKRPDILFGTPGSLLTTLSEMGKDIAQRIVSRVGYIVVDEADLMLAGSYRPQLDRLIQMMHICEREMTIEYLHSILNIGREDFFALPRHIKRAAIEHGLQGMIENGYEPAQEISSKEDKGPFWRKQYILVGATIPSLGTKNIRDEIQELFPRVEIIATENLHKPGQQLEYEWTEIDAKDRLEALVEAIQKDKGFQNHKFGKILVFTKDSRSADSTAQRLIDHDFYCVSHHKKMRGVDRTSNLEKFRMEQGIIMVSTDGLSRGMDIPDISHIIQCNFAPSAITFVHRIGRTGRAGKPGKITSFCTEQDKDLAEAIRDCIEEGIPIEGAFSRNRSFRKKFRRYGRFIPRGYSPKESNSNVKNESKPNSDKKRECTELECPI